MSGTRECTKYFADCDLVRPRNSKPAISQYHLSVETKSFRRLIRFCYRRALFAAGMDLAAKVLLRGLPMGSRG